MCIIRLKINLFIALFVSSHLALATTISYQDTYPELSIGTTIVGLDFITQLNTSAYGQALLMVLNPSKAPTVNLLRLTASVIYTVLQMMEAKNYYLI